MLATANSLPWEKIFFPAVFVLGVIAVILIGTYSLVKELNAKPEELRLQSEYLIPDGYTFLAGANHGLFADKATFYCTQNSTGKVFVCDNYKAGRQIIPPKGYTITGVSSDYFLCTEDSTGKLFTCVDK